MRCAAPRSVEWRVGIVIGFALVVGAGVAAGCHSAENAFAAILATVSVQILRHRRIERIGIDECVTVTRSTPDLGDGLMDGRCPLALGRPDGAFALGRRSKRPNR
jgi:hypothetical protein